LPESRISQTTGLFDLLKLNISQATYSCTHSFFEVDLYIPNHSTFYRL